MFTLEDVLNSIGAYSPYGDLPHTLQFETATYDSREVRPGSLFIALRGERDNGHRYIADAYRRGASGVLAERPPETALPPADADAHPFAYLIVPSSLAAIQSLAAAWYARYPVPVVAVTGSVGKTTNKEVIAAVLSQQYRTLKNPKNLNGEFGMPLALLELRPEHERAVLEMGMLHAGEIAQQCSWVHPRIGVVTNVGISHIEKLGSQDAIQAAKQELVDALPEDGIAILNRSDPRVWAMAAHSRARVVSYGWEPDADIWTDHDSVVLDGTHGIRFLMHERLSSGSEQVHEIATSLLGRHNALTCMAAAAVGLLDGVSWEAVERGLTQTPEYARLVARRGRAGATILDDTYNAAPDSMRVALDVLAASPGRKVAILGDMYELGVQEQEAHEYVGRYAAELGKLDLLLAVGPRGRIIGETAAETGLKQVIYCDSVADVQFDPQQGDVVLVKGSRGMAMERIVAQLVAPREEGAA